MATTYYNRAQVSRILGVKSPNLEKRHPDFFAKGRPGPNGRLWTEKQVQARCAEIGIEFDPEKAAPAKR